MRRGDLVTVTLQGDFGKPRPALVIQGDQFGELSSLAVLPVTSALIDAPLFRITLRPSKGNGLQKPSQVMVDKPMTVRLERVGSVVGHIEAESLVEVERSLAVFLGIAK